MNRERYVVEEVSHSQLSMVPFSSFRNGREAAKALKDRQRDAESSSSLCFKKLVVDVPKWGIRKSEISWTYLLCQACHLDILMKTQGEKN